MSQYNKQGLYNGYDKNNKEREALDYYATPTTEVENILQTLCEQGSYNFKEDVVLEPCAGGGHMVKGLETVCKRIIATDIQERGNISNTPVLTGKEYDFLSDDYEFTDNIDWVIMNPPYSVIEPFTMKALEIANKGVLLLGRLQFLESQKRYENIFIKNPPTDTFVYVDRIQCYKNGDMNIKGESAQAYAWFLWDKYKIQNNYPSTLHWIRRKDKK